MLVVWDRDAENCDRVVVIGRRQAQRSAVMSGSVVATGVALCLWPLALAGIMVGSAMIMGAALYGKPEAK